MQVIESITSFCVILLVCCQFTNASEPTVTIDDGTLIGSYSNDRNGRQFAQFLEIPYGHVPERFEMSEPVKPWNGTKIANKSTSGCARHGVILKIFEGTEDCLTLDVYTPKVLNPSSNDTLLPVMVWIYGGGFIDGVSYIYGGQYLMEQDVVLVVVNYRLGSLGFLNAGVKSARGNQGLKDMVLGLKWVQKNIAKFSGDNNRVTIFGESAGGAAVSLLTLSPMAKGLFHGAIMQSGTALCPYVMRSNPGIKYAKQLAAALDCPSSNAEYLVQCLKRIKPEELVKHQNFFNEFGFDYDTIQFGPTFETTFPDESNETIFIKDDPLLLAERGEFNKVPMIIGFVSNEMYTTVAALLSNPKMVEKLNRQFGKIYSSNLWLEVTEEDPFQSLIEIKKFFLQDKEITKDSVYDIETLQNDRHLLHCTRVIAEEYAKHVPVYVYNYTRKEPVKDSEKALLYKRVPVHADELHYLFRVGGDYAAFFPVHTEGDPGFNFSKTFVSLWASFARDGKPEKVLTTEKTEIEWIPLEVGKPQKYFQIDNIPFMKEITEDFLNRWTFWKNLSLKKRD